MIKTLKSKKSWKRETMYFLQNLIKLHWLLTMIKDWFQKKHMNLEQVKICSNKKCRNIKQYQNG